MSEPNKPKPTRDQINAISLECARASKIKPERDDGCDTCEPPDESYCEYCAKTPPSWTRTRRTTMSEPSKPKRDRAEDVLDSMPYDDRGGPILYRPGTVLAGLHRMERATLQRAVEVIDGHTCSNPTSRCNCVLDILFKIRAMMKEASGE